MESRRSTRSLTPHSEETHISEGTEYGTSWHVFADDVVWIGTAEGAYVKSNAGALLLKGRHATRFMDQLSSRLTCSVALADALSNVPDRKRPAFEDLISQLRTRGMIQELVAPAAASQKSKNLKKADGSVLRYLISLTASERLALETLATLEATRILVFGTDDVCSSAIETQLRQLGCENVKLAKAEASIEGDLIASAEFVILVAKAEASEMTRQLAEACWRQRKVFVAGVTMGPYTIVGPVTIPDQPGCVECVRARLIDSVTMTTGENDARPSAVRGVVERTADRIRSSLLIGGVVLELIHYFTKPSNRLPSPPQFLLSSTGTNSTYRRTIIPYERCAVCARAKDDDNLALATVAALVEVVSRDVPIEPAGSDVLDTFTPLIDEHVGLIRRLDEAGFVQVPLARSQVTIALPLRSGGSAQICCVGSGLTYRASRQIAAQRGLAQYLGSRAANSMTLYGSPAEMRRRGFLLALVNLDEPVDQETEWTWGFRLPTLRLVVVPTKAYQFDWNSAHHLTGVIIGTGSTFQELLEDVVRGAARSFITEEIVKGATSTCRLRVDSCESDGVRRLVRAAQSLGVDPVLHAIEHRLGVPAVRAVRPDGRFLVAVGRSRAEAVEEALRAIVQEVQSSAHGESPDSFLHWNVMTNDCTDQDNSSWTEDGGTWTLRGVLESMTANEIAGVCVPFGSLPIENSRFMAAGFRFD